MAEKLKYTKLGRYKLESLIGKGAMGVVYKAYDPVIERYVAIKAVEIGKNLPLEEYDEYMQRFSREAQAAGRLSHPNIVTIYDVSQDKETGIPYIVMEFIEGQNLNYFLNTGMMFSLEDTLMIIDQVADALNYAHQQGIIHRDIKCSNIMLQKGLKVKVMDFGIARLATSTLTREGQYLGTPNYMSPEQIKGKNIDKRSDIFSLGIVFYRLLTGERPFQADSFAAISYKILNEEPIPPTQLNHLLPEGVNSIVAKMLAKEPLRRYQSAYSIREDIWKIQSGETIQTENQLSPSADIKVIKSSVEKKKYFYLFLLVAFFGILITAIHFKSNYTQTKTSEKININVPKSSIEKENKKNINDVSSLEFNTYKQFAINYFNNKNYEKALANLLYYLSINSEDNEALKYLYDSTSKVMENPIKCDAGRTIHSIVDLSTNLLPSGYLYFLQDDNLCLITPTSYNEIHLQVKAQSGKSNIKIYLYSEKDKKLIKWISLRELGAGEVCKMKINYNKGEIIGEWISN